MTPLPSLLYSLVVCLSSDCQTYTERLEGALHQCEARRQQYLSWPAFNAPRLYCTIPISAKRPAPSRSITFHFDGEGIWEEVDDSPAVDPE